MSLIQIMLQAKTAKEEIFAQYQQLIARSATVARHIDDQLRYWQANTATVLDEQNPLKTVAQQLGDWKATITAQGIQRNNLLTALENYQGFCETHGIPMNKKFWDSQLLPPDLPGTDTESTDRDWSIAGKILLKEWQKELDKAKARWELEILGRMRKALLEKLRQTLDLLQQLDQQLEALGLDPGLLLDLSKGQLTAQDIQALQRWLKYLAEDKSVRAICELLGKLRQLELSERTERVKVSLSRSIPLPDINSREEIVGIRLGRDIEHALPGELALLADPETALLFDLKYVESRLMCFDMQDMQNVHEHYQTDEDRQVCEQEKLGPMIICIDTSGSMHGMPETIAKAVTLYMASKAREQKRPCYLINFSTDIESLDLGAGLEMESLINFLRMSFQGGTDLAPALAHALDVMQQDDYRHADLLMVSDFIMAGLPCSLRENIDLQRNHGNRFYSLVVGSAYMSERLKSLFDQEWIFNPRTSQIHELISFHNKMNGQQDAEYL